METQKLVNEYRRRAHSIGISIWHFEWCTKYRNKMFGKEKYFGMMTACIGRAVSLHEIKIVVIEVLPEHVHCEVELSLDMAPSKALQILIGLSSKLFFQHHRKARLRYPKGHLWSRGKFVASLGFVQREVVTEYIKNQRVHHGLGNRFTSCVAFNFKV